MLEQYYQLNEAAGVNITIAKDGYGTVHACQVQVRNNRLDIVKKVPGLASMDELVKKNFPAGMPLALNLVGKGILQKQLAKITTIDQQNFGQILPNAKLEDFYIQNFISGEQSFVSVIRKTEADKWIKQLRELGFKPLLLSLGPFASAAILPQLNLYGEEVLFDGHRVLLNEQKEWTAVHYNEAVLSQFPLKVESETLDEKLVLAYAGAFQLVLAAKLELIRAEANGLDIAFSQMLQEKKLKVQGLIILAVFFMLLLVNFILFSGLNASNARLSEKLSRSARSTSDVAQLTDQVQQKEALLKIVGWEGGINKTVLVDQVASLLPREITWKEVSVDPVNLTSSRTLKTLVFYDHTLRITGNSEKIIPVNEWISRIKTKPWVKDVQLNSYTFNSELNTGQFTLIIGY